ncbi:PLD-like domain-containing protein [Rhizobiales bacterium GAS191]|jgi:phosphatidylserine/phosphatidylglycerophosphate/cardiolipin synthase-like enzyme|nr:PLD-like domain-containing protein [Rhizobiales bacterium GAS113]SEC61976.1 PLD-like domain-containing protein [Rhizobiales bacterium GAS191]
MRAAYRPARRHIWGRPALVAVGLGLVAGLEILTHAREARPLGSGPVEIRYAPAADLERFDLALLRSANRSIDIAAYLLTDIGLIEALADAAARGVHVRLYLDGGQEASGPGFAGRARGLREAQRIEVRLKPPGSEIMHLKSYCVDGKVLRTGSANFTVSGLKREDDDLVVIRDPAAIATFEQTFETMWRRAGNMSETVGSSRM